MNKVILNKEQIEAVNYNDGPLLIIAGAGTGKTTVITEKVKNLILEKNIHPSNILALTFTEKAALEMEERIDVALPLGYSQMWISTFHAFCDKILRLEAVHIGLNPSYTLTTEAESLMFLRKNLFKLNLNYFRPLGNPNKFLQGLLQHFSRLKDEDISPQEYLLFAKKLKLDKATEKLEKEKILELANAYSVYEDLKVKENVMDFGDLITNTLKLFRMRPNVLKEYQNQFSYILVDEFQDTNFSQNQLALLLAGKRRNITVVGDDDQAIYRWRGAAVSNMIQFRKHFPKAKVVTLTKNYRSTKNILEGSYQLIQYNNPDRLEVKEKVNKKLTSERNVLGEKIELIFESRVENEAEKVIEKINKLKTKYSYRDFAILVRANDHAQSFVRTLERYKIPFQFLGPGQLFHREEIKDLIAYLKILYNFEDSSSLYRVLTMDIWKLNALDIAVLLNFAKKNHLNLFETLSKDIEKLSINGKETVTKIYEMIKKHLDKIPKNTAGQILYYFLEDSGLLQKYLQVNKQADETKAQNIAKFFDKLKTYETDHDDASVFAIVDWIDLSMQMGESPLATNEDWQQNNAVNVLTVHSSKGMEFPVVFLVNLVNQRFPSRERKEQIPIPQKLIKEILPTGDFHLQEERRIFYVGMTRARDRLYLTASNFYGEGKRERKISTFVNESLSKKGVDKITRTDKQNHIQLSLLNIFPRESNDEVNVNNIPYNVNYLSYSQINTFDICPLHYKLRYILNVPTPASASQNLGLSLHSSLREIYLSYLKNKSAKIDIKQILKNNWIIEGYYSKAHEQLAFEKAVNILRNYLKNNLRLNNLPAALEVPFQFRIYSNLKIAGRIDRVDKIEKNKIEIIDYKTGANIPTEKELSSNLQLTIYALAATEIKDTLFGRSPEEILLSLHFLEENKILTTTRTKKELEEAKMNLISKAKEISESSFKCSGNSLCQNCEYKMLCQSPHFLI